MRIFFKSCFAIRSGYFRFDFIYLESTVFFLTPGVHYTEVCQGIPTPHPLPPTSTVKFRVTMGKHNYTKASILYKDLITLIFVTQLNFLKHFFNII